MPAKKKKEAKKGIPEKKCAGRVHGRRNEFRGTVLP